MAHRILIVEDDRGTRRALVAIFAKLGLVSTEAANIKEALERLNRETEIICLDLMLPDGNGIEVLRHVRENAMPAKVAVISGADEPQILTDLTSLKPDAIFGKPLELDDFIEWLETLGVATDRRTKPRTQWRVAS